MKKLFSSPIVKTVGVVAVVLIVLKFVVPKLPIPAAIKQYNPLG